MSERICAASPAGLAAVNAAIHDAWFSVYDLALCEASGEFRVLFTHDESPGFRAQRRVLASLSGRRAGTLVVRRVASWDFEDRHRVVWYDINFLRHSVRDGWVELVTNIPLLVRLRVSALDVYVDPCGESGRPEACVAL